MVFPICDLSTLEAKAHEFRVLGQFRLSSKIVSFKEKEKVKAATTVIVTSEKYAVRITQF